MFVLLTVALAHESAEAPPAKEALARSEWNFEASSQLMPETVTLERRCAPTESAMATCWQRCASIRRGSGYAALASASTSSGAAGLST